MSRHLSDSIKESSPFFKIPSVPVPSSTDDDTDDQLRISLKSKHHHMSNSSLYTEDKEEVTIANLTNKARGILIQMSGRLERNTQPEKQSLLPLKSILNNIDQMYTLTLREMLELQNQNTALTEWLRCLEDQLHETREQHK